MLVIKQVWSVKEECRICGEENVTLIYENYPTQTKINKDFELKNGDDMNHICNTCKDIEHEIQEVRKGITNDQASEWLIKKFKERKLTLGEATKIIVALGGKWVLEKINKRKGKQCL